MSQYPVLLSGMRLTGAKAASMIPDLTVKAAATDRSSTATLANDAELVGIALGVGTWMVEVMLAVATPTSATPDIKTAWAFTGTWNNPLRSLVGPGTANTAGSTAITDVTMRGVNAETSYTYGLPNSTAYNIILESSYQVTVSVAGNLSVQWAQGTSDAGITSVKPGSMVRVKQIGA